MAETNPKSNPGHGGKHRSRHSRNRNRGQNNKPLNSNAIDLNADLDSVEESSAAPQGGSKRSRRNRRNRRERPFSDSSSSVPQPVDVLSDDAPSSIFSPASTRLDREYGFVTESTEELPVEYDETGAPAAVDFDYIPGAQKVPEPTEEEKAEMTMVVGVKFRNSAHSYYFSPGKLKIGAGTAVLVETARGMEYGIVSFSNKYVRNSEITQPLREIVRIATAADTAQHQANLELEDQAFFQAKAQIERHGLDMKLIEAQYTFDNSKLLFYFSSDGRVDFRDLVKDLASQFHTRIELRQIGIRDEARMLGGLGACGRKLCCAGFLQDFVQVSIKMAKEQNLSLNSTKISGCCGRLLCCLHYEHETYEQEIARTPPVDSVVQTPDGIGVITSTNPLAATVRVMLKNEKGEVTQTVYPRDTVTVLPKDALPEYFYRKPSDSDDNASSGSRSDKRTPARKRGEKSTVAAPKSEAAPAAESAPESGSQEGPSDPASPDVLANIHVSYPTKHRKDRPNDRKKPDKKRPRPQTEAAPGTAQDAPASAGSAPDIPFAAQIPMPGENEPLDGVVRPAQFNRKRRGRRK